MYKIGIIGRGFVGSAVAHGFSQGVAYDSEIKIYDKDPSKSQNTLEEVVTFSDFENIGNLIEITQFLRKKTFLNQIVKT